MIPLRAEVVEAYRTFLGRDPENEAAILANQAGHASTVAMVAALLRSAEYRALDRKNRLAEFTGVSPELIALLEAFRIAGSPAPGYLVDFIGTRTDVAFAGRLAGLSGAVEDLPVPRGVQGSATAWAGVLAAVDESLSRNRFTVVEMGGGWAPWAVSGAVAARQRGIRQIRLIADAADLACAGLVVRHLMNNGFNPNDHIIQHATSAVDLAASLDNAAASAAVDLCVVALDAADTIAAAIAALNARVRRLVITTTSRLTEARLLACLADHGWSLERDEPSRLAALLASRADDAGPGAGGQARVQDGVQVWRNNGLDR
jgi:hypothetical protein